METQSRPVKLLDQVRQRVRLLRYSSHTEKVYVHWIRQFIIFHHLRHPLELGVNDVEAFLTHLAEGRHLSPSSQNQALSAILFLYRLVLGIPPDERIHLARAHRPKHLPVILSKQEVQRVLTGMSGTPQLVAQLLYGTGLRIQECLNLRVHHLDFGNNWILVVDGKGNKDRVTLLPNSLRPKLEAHLERVEALHLRDIRSGLGFAYLPHAYHLKNPAAVRDFRWQFVFPSSRISRDAKTGFRGRWHISRSAIAKSMARSSMQAGVRKRVTPHVLRHCFATHLLDTGCDIRMIQSLLGHKSVTPTMVYAHLVESRRQLLESPIDAILQE
jgi:integron integrase